MKKNCEVIVSKKQEEVDDDLIVWEILTRLPAKSLMRFKCVSKHWQSVIHKDHFFINLHLARSNTTTRRLLLVGKPTYTRTDNRMYLLSEELLLPSNEEDGCVEVGSICRWEPPIPSKNHVSICTLDGLICFMDWKSSSARVYNSSTRESTPWIKSTIKQHEDKIVADMTFQEDDFTRILFKKLWSGKRKEKELSFVKHAFGYDPATKEHKVIAMWELRWYGGTPPGGGVYFWEVMTVGQNSWRRIDGIDPSISPGKIECWVYLNGYIYLVCNHSGFLGTSIVEFSVGNEKFRFVETLARYLFARDMRRTELIQVNGRLCVLTYNNTRQDYTCTSVNMRRKTTATNSSNYHWGEQTIMLPRYTELNLIRHIPGTDLFIIGSADNGLSFYHYNQKNRIYIQLERSDG